VNTDGFRKALAPVAFVFPHDHGAHHEFKTEWWYFTGNLSTADERRFGYQLTLFRVAVTPKPPDSASAWATNQTYMAHFAVTDVDGEAFYDDERFARGALGLAGVDAMPFRAWLEDWHVTEDPNTAARGCDGCLNLRIAAGNDEAAIELLLNSNKPAVRHGDNGLSQKSATPGNASYYYSLTRLATEGTVKVGGQTHAVTGHSWFDHEWSTSALEDDQAGWDWFSLQLSGQVDLMLFRLRARDPAVADFVSGSYVGPDGRVSRLHPGDFAIEVLDSWTSPATGVTYPAQWRISIPQRGLVLDVTPRVQRQELNAAFRYWEGAVGATGRQRDHRISGEGYVELTGYQ
jgi:predicted secreted hydrolase